MKKVKPINRSEIRSLLLRQRGRCAISGIKIKPSTVSLDHIVPLARKEFSKKKRLWKSLVGG